MMVNLPLQRARDRLTSLELKVPCTGRFAGCAADVDITMAALAQERPFRSLNPHPRQQHAECRPSQHVACATSAYIHRAGAEKTRRRGALLRTARGVVLRIAYAALVATADKSARPNRLSPAHVETAGLDRWKFTPKRPSMHVRPCPRVLAPRARRKATVWLRKWHFLERGILRVGSRLAVAVLGGMLTASP